MCIDCLKLLKAEKKTLENYRERIHKVKVESINSDYYFGELKVEIENVTVLVEARLNQINYEIGEWVKIMN